MRKSSLSVLAASAAFIPSAAFAQAAPPPMVGAPAYGPQMAPMMAPPNVPRRLERGWQVNPYWFGPQFTINNWQAYGFSDPGAGRHWIRYYDDAYLIDSTGHVVDARGGLDWDQYGEQWDMVNGIPAYRGAREWRPGDRDYAWHANSAAGYQYGYPVNAPMPGQAYGYTQMYGGYGYYGAPVVIYQIGGAAAAGAAAYSEEVIEEYVEQAQTQRRRPVRRARAPRRPPPGERG